MLDGHGGMSRAGDHRSEEYLFLWYLCFNAAEHFSRNLDDVCESSEREA